MVLRACLSQLQLTENLWLCQGQGHAMQLLMSLTEGTEEGS